MIPSPLNVRKIFSMENNDTEYEIYKKLIMLLQEVKATFGPNAVSGTLLKRPIIRNFLKNYQKKNLDSYEKVIANLK